MHLQVAAIWAFNDSKETPGGSETSPGPFVLVLKVRVCWCCGNPRNPSPEYGPSKDGAPGGDGGDGDPRFGNGDDAVEGVALPELAVDVLVVDMLPDVGSIRTISSSKSSILVLDVDMVKNND